MAKLTRQQIKAARQQAKESRAKKEELSKLKDGCSELTKEEIYELDRVKNQRKKDLLGLSNEERKQIRSSNIDNDSQTVKVSWNIAVGDLVYLPDNTVGMVVKENAKNIKSAKHSHDNKRNLSKSHGLVFVITSSGNDWFYPSKLKKVV